MASLPHDRRLRIAHYHTRLPEAGRKPGGVEVAVHRLANALVDLGKDDVTVVSATPAPSDARYRSESFLAAYPVLYRNYIPQFTILPLALNFFDFSRFDVVHLHGDDWFYVHRRTPTVRTLYGSALREAQHGTGWRGKLLMYGVYPLEYLSARLARLPLALGNDAASIYHIDNLVSIGVDDTAFFSGPKTPTPRVVYVGAWKGRKRGQFVYETFLREVLPRVPAAELCMVSDHCIPHPRVIFERFPDELTLSRRYREAWVMASASTYEAFGIPYIEALASGTPVVTTANFGASDILRSGEFGVITSDSNFGSEIARLLEDHERRARLAERGLEHSREYAWPRLAQTYRQLYFKVLDGDVAQQALRGGPT